MHRRLAALALLTAIASVTTTACSGTPAPSTSAAPETAAGGGQLSGVSPSRESIEQLLVRTEELPVAGWTLEPGYSELTAEDAAGDFCSAEFSAPLANSAIVNGQRSWGAGESTLGQIIAIVDDARAVVAEYESLAASCERNVIPQAGAQDDLIFTVEPLPLAAGDRQTGFRITLGAEYGYTRLMGDVVVTALDDRHVSLIGMMEQNELADTEELLAVVDAAQAGFDERNLTE